MLKVQDLYKAAIAQTDAAALFDYELSGYISDLVHEVVDGQVDCYNSDLFRWLSDATGSEGYMERVISEGLVATGYEYNFFSHIQAAQYLYIEDEINGALDDCDTVAAAAMRYLVSEEIKEITGEQLGEIESLNLSDFDTFAEFNEAVLEIVSPDEEEENEEESLTA